MDNCWRKSTESFGEWLALLGFCFRPDISFAVKELSHRLADTQVRDVQCCKRRYLSKHEGLGCFSQQDFGENLDGFSLVAYSEIGPEIVKVVNQRHAE